MILTLASFSFHWLTLTRPPPSSVDLYSSPGSWATSAGAGSPTLPRRPYPFNWSQLGAKISNILPCFCYCFVRFFSYTCTWHNPWNHPLFGRCSPTRALAPACISLICRTDVGSHKWEVCWCGVLWSAEGLAASKIKYVLVTHSIVDVGA